MTILCENMANKICFIFSRDKVGTGFFCNFRYFHNIMNVLMINYHLLDEKDLLIDKKINFFITDKYGNDKRYKILMDESRKIYTNKEYDITIIEIKKEDNIDNISFFDIDNRIFENPIEIFLNEQIFMLYYYNKDHYLYYSNGIIREIKKNNYTIVHLCYNDWGSGAPLINSTNFQVIGIHIGTRIKDHKALAFYGGLLKEPIEKFYEKYNLENKYIKNDNILIKKNNDRKIDLCDDRDDRYCCCRSIYNMIPKSISLKRINDLRWLMEKAISKIDCNDGRKGTGFFCEIEFENKFFLKVLITTNSVLNKTDLSIGKTIKYSVNNGKINYEILVDEFRKKYTNEEYNITIIEIKGQDNCKFLEFVYDNKCPYYEQMLLLHYSNDEIKFSNGRMKNIEDNNILKYSLDEDYGSSGGPLINSYFKVFGIHLGPYFDLGYGRLLFEPIKDFFEKYVLEKSKYEK